MKQNIKLPDFPLDRVIAEGAFFTAGICPICHSTMFKEHILFGEKYCINNDCENNKQLIKFRSAIKQMRENKYKPTNLWLMPDNHNCYLASDEIDRSQYAKLIHKFR